jgi:hypothetical protein
MWPPSVSHMSVERSHQPPSSGPRRDPSGSIRNRGVEGAGREKIVARLLMNVVTVLPVPAVGVTGDGLGCGMANGSEASGVVRPAGSVAPVGQAAAQLGDAGGQPPWR